MEIKILGCGDAFGSGGRFNTCFLLNTSKTRSLIDCGATSLTALKKNGIDTNSIDSIIISHFHGDHYGGVPFILLEMAVVKNRKRPLDIISPPGCKERLKDMLNRLYSGSEVLEKLKINFLSYSQNKIETEHFSLTSYPVIHSPGSLPHAVRIEAENKVIGFSGDTEWTDELIKVADQADVFICECNFYKLNVKGHLNYTTLEKKEKQFECKKLFLTHFGEEMLQNLENVKFNCLEDGMSINF